MGIRLCAYIAAATRNQHTTAQVSRCAIEAKPNRQVNLTRYLLDFQLDVAHFEESLLKNQPQHFFAQQFIAANLREHRCRMVSGGNRNRFGLARRCRKFKNVQRTIDRIERAAMRSLRAAHTIPDAINTEWKVRIGDALQRTAAHFPKPGRQTSRGERGNRVGARDVWPQASNHSRFHRDSFTLLAPYWHLTENKSTTR